MNDKDEIIQKLMERIISLEKLVAKQAEEIAELKKRLNRNSNNSSKPPSSGGFKKPVQNNREKTNKKTGGQAGHEGKTLEFAVPDEIMTLAVSNCVACKKDLTQTEPLSIEKRQRHDLPSIKLHITEYQAEKKRCCCGHLNVGLFPNEIQSSIQYGPRIKGLALYLHQEQKLPYARCCQFLKDYFGTWFSQGTLFNTQVKSYEHLETIEKQIREALIKSKVMHNDETGLHVNKNLQWLHVASTTSLTTYEIHKKRGVEAINAIGILPQFQGTSVHDGYKSYFCYSEMKHGLCNAHHLRELKAFEEDGQKWALNMRRCLKEACHLVNEAKRAGQEQLPATITKAILILYRSILFEGNKEVPRIETQTPGKRGRPKQEKARNLLERLRDHEEAVLRFVTDFTVPFTNNQGERDIRMVKLKEKISGGFRSELGAKMFARITGYLSTLRKQGMNIAEAMTALAGGCPLIPHF